MRAWANFSLSATHSSPALRAPAFAQNLPKPAHSLLYIISKKFMVSAEAVKKLREKTGASMMECKKALEEAQGDEAKALEILNKRGASLAEKKAERQIKAGLIDAYIHANGKIGVLLELGCESDFVVRNEIFKNLAHEICLQISAMNPADEMELLAQPFVKNPEQTVQGLINEAIAKLGENIKIGKFIRFEI